MSFNPGIEPPEIMTTTTRSSTANFKILKPIPTIAPKPAMNEYPTNLQLAIAGILLLLLFIVYLYNVYRCCCKKPEEEPPQTGVELRVIRSGDDTERYGSFEGLEEEEEESTEDSFKSTVESPI